jgi:hypothetical protein
MTFWQNCSIFLAVASILEIIEWNREMAKKHPAQEISLKIPAPCVNLDPKRRVNQNPRNRQPNAMTNRFNG